MQKILLLFILILSLCCTACGDKYVEVVKYDNTTHISQNSKFEVVSVENKSMFKKQLQDFDTNAELKKSINDELIKQNLFGKDYIIKSTITDYKPGNAAKRWLLPGYGTTKLTVENIIYTKDNKAIISVPAEANISFGGLYSIGGYKTVFSQVAKLVVNAIKKDLLGIKTQPKKDNQ